MGLFGDILGSLGGMVKSGPTIRSSERDDFDRSFSLFGESKDEFDPNDHRDETKRLISEAKEMVREGDSIIEDARSSVQSAQDDAQRAISNHTDLCQAIARELGEEIVPTVQKFNAFNIDARISSPSIGLVTIPSFNVAMSCEKRIVDTPRRVDILSRIFDEYQYDKAQEQHAEAKRYHAKACEYRSKTYGVCDRLSMIVRSLSHDDDVLRELSKKVVSITEQLKSAMTRATFTQDEATYLKGVSKIAESMCSLMSTRCVESDASLNSDFQRQMDFLQKINSEIPSAPSISDQRLLSYIRSLHDATIR